MGTTSSIETKRRLSRHRLQIFGRKQSCRGIFQLERINLKIGDSVLDDEFRTGSFFRQDFKIREQEKKKKKQEAEEKR